ncbi:MAG: type II toxin-antitoxin system PemK/MazF family toxin [Proteobacteria bacterium]|nr:type II toxin-antitoxin system PemK/MazF family toxin [Pseudomonadota bacterium]
MIVKQGDFIWLDFDPQAEHEQAKRRPALVISNSLFNQAGLAVVCPITSTPPKGGYHVVIPNPTEVKGTILINQAKSLDYRARKASFIEKCPELLLEDILERHSTIFSKDNNLE